MISMNSLNVPIHLLELLFCTPPEPTQWWNGLQCNNDFKRGKMEPLIYPSQTTFSNECLKSCPPTDRNTEHLQSSSPEHPSMPTTTARETDACKLHPCMDVMCKMTGWRDPQSWMEDGRMVSLGWWATPAPTTAKQIIQKPIRVFSVI